MRKHDICPFLQGGAKNDHALRHGSVVSTRPHPYQTQIKSIPPSSTHRYLPALSRASFTWAFWRCEGGSSPLNVIFGHDPHGAPHFTDCQNKHHKRIYGCSNPKPRPSRPIGGVFSACMRLFWGETPGYREYLELYMGFLLPSRPTYTDYFTNIPISIYTGARMGQ